MGRKEGRDASASYYCRGLAEAEWAVAKDVYEIPADTLGRVFEHSSEQMSELPDNSVALTVMSPPDHVGKEYDGNGSIQDYLDMIRQGRRPYRPLSAMVTSMAMEIGFFCRGEVIWVKAAGAAGNCAWGSWRSASNPTLRDLHEYCLWFSKGRLDRALVNNGALTLATYNSGAADIACGAGGSLTNAGTGIIDLAGDSSISYAGDDGCPFTNTGTVTKSAGTTTSPYSGSFLGRPAHQLGHH